jgi:hypothetical protein
MSAIPPSVIGSVLASPAAQSEQAKPADADRNAQADGARLVAGGPDAILEIEATDAATRVDAESGGAGSQGRQDAPPEEEEQPAEPQTSGLTVGADGRPHLDVSA